jgi:hypothetical protein
MRNELVNGSMDYPKSGIFQALCPVGSHTSHGITKATSLSVGREEHQEKALEPKEVLLSTHKNRRDIDPSG